MSDDLDETLRSVRAQLERREADLAHLDALVRDARDQLALISRHRRRGTVALWDSAQRGALRTVVLAVACVAVVCGASVLDPTLGGAAIVLAFAVLSFEGVR
jgi:hypothetical protein